MADHQIQDHGLFKTFRKLFRRQQQLSPQEIFTRFQAVLNSNNKALEIIADLGEKGSGDFIFDLHYIERTLEDLHQTVAASIKALNLLCNNRYLELNHTLERLHQDLQGIISGREDEQGEPVQALADITPGDWGRVGGKAGHLAELYTDPLVQVPDGFVITTRSFHELMDVAGLRPLYEDFRNILIAGDADPDKIQELRMGLAAGISRAESPKTLLKALKKGLARLEKDADQKLTTFAVRSSAPEEDQECSFAGQFHSVLNVAPEPKAIFTAYLQVVASLFSESAVHYHQQMFPGNGDLLMAACCQPMIDAAVSGVAYSLDPAAPLDETLVIVGAWGLGAAVVEGRIATDAYTLNKAEPPTVLNRQIGDKATGLYFDQEQGHLYREIEADRRRQPCLNAAQLLELANALIHLENRFRRPLDVEWTFDEKGRLFILQARPLHIPTSRTDRRELSESLQNYECIASHGKVAQQGIGCGPVFPFSTSKDLDRFPENAVLVSRRDSSRFVKVMSRAAAILTETGTPVSHMATLCREMKVPCLVGLDGIRDKLSAGEEITVDADDNRVYRGRVVELLAYRAASGMQLAVSREFRLLRKVLRRVSLLNLVDPHLDNFSPSGCHTYHDILRFAHETAVQVLVNLGRDENRLLKDHLARHLELPVPVGIIVIDIGGGLIPEAPLRQVHYQEVASVPFRAILQGMLFPDVWHRVSMHVGIRDMMHSMLSAPTAALEGSYTGHNIAIIGANYVNLCFRLGYHFNIVDAYCSEKERDNHIYFRFLGGASDLSKRTRRAMLIEKILSEFDFRIKTRGDLVIARHGNLIRSDMERMLDIIGRLVGFTRQLDVTLDTDAIVDYYADAFLMGDYGVLARDA